MKWNLTPETFTFGDTLIFAWSFDDSPECKPIALSFISFWLAWFIQDSMARGILFRGAVATGEYVSSGNTILGKAVADAAIWYEKADWSGAIATPSCGIAIEWFKRVKAKNANEYVNCLKNVSNDTLAASILEEVYSSGFVQYSIPLKEGNAEPMWAVAWPKALLRKNEENCLSAEIELYAALNKLHISKGTEVKYANSIKFFDFCMQSKCNSKPE
jgi:hypothetical protein